MEPNINPGEIDCWVVPFWWPSLTVWVARQYQQSCFFLNLGREPPASGMAEFCQLEDDTAAKTPVSTAEKPGCLSLLYLSIYRCLNRSLQQRCCTLLHHPLSSSLCFWCLKFHPLVLGTCPLELPRVLINPLGWQYSNPIQIFTTTSMVPHIYIYLYI